jgi:asparagine synthase (glutamine-hydrolysing)
MVDDATGVARVYTGEIYTFVELRADLERLGHRFATSGDTEVLLRGYLEWGADVFPRCNGMWAAAIDDPSADGVLLSRDRFGEKPLHLGRHADGSWWFASELKPLLDLGVGDRRLDLARTLGFLALGDIEDPTAAYVAGITQVPPGTTVRLTERGPGAPRPWFCLDRLLDEARSGTPASEDEVLAALDRSVELRLRSDVEVGTSLSGGVDSSAVVASLRAVDPDRPLHAFTASFPGRDIDEWDRAALVAERFDVTIHRVEPTADGFVDDLDRLVEHQGGPIESPTVYAQWCVMRRAHEEGVTVLLDGQGADETWGGYPKYVGFGLVDGIGRGRPRQSLALARAWDRTPRVDLRQVAGLAASGRAGQPLRKALVGLRGRPLGPALADVAVHDPQQAGRGPLLQRAARADLGRVVLPRLLRYADRNSMAWSREVRLPFLDPEVVRLALGSDWFGGFSSGWTKAALRRAVGRRLPGEIAWRRDKTAYEVPDHEWLARADVQAMVQDSAATLHAHGLLAGPSAQGMNAWRVLSLGRLVERYRLTP